MELMQNLYTPKDQMSLEWLKEDIMAGPKLARTEPSRIFYIKKDWSKDGIRKLIMQEDESVEAIKAEAQ